MLNEYKDYVDRYQQLVEYTNVAGDYNISEVGDEEETPDALPADDGSQDAPQGMDAQPGDDAEMNGQAPDRMDGGGQPQGVDGFDPQGGSPDQGIEGMGGQPMAGPNDMPSQETPETDASSEDVVIDVDDLTRAQKEAEEKIDKMNGKFETLMGAIETLIKQNKERDEREKAREEQMKAELDKRLPDDTQKLAMRSIKSTPYGISPNDYMKDNLPDNYTVGDEAEEKPKYTITKGDIDNITDFNTIAKELDIEHQGLKDILNF